MDNNEIIYDEELVEQFKENASEEDVQTTFNEDSIDVLVVEGDVENVEVYDEN